MIDTDKYEGHTPGPWEIIEWEVPNPQWDVMLSCPEVGKFASIQGSSGWRPTEVDVELIAAAPDLLAEVKRLRHLCDTLFIYTHNIETGQSIIEKSNGEPLSTIDFEKDMTWVNWVNQPKISNIKIGGISYLKITDDSIHSDGEADYVLASECKAGHYVGEIGYEDCPDCGGEEE